MSQVVEKRDIPLSIKNNFFNFNEDLITISWRTHSVAFGISNDESAYRDFRIPRSIDPMRAHLESSAGQDHRRRAVSLAHGFKCKPLEQTRRSPWLQWPHQNFRGESSRENLLGRAFRGVRLRNDMKSNILEVLKSVSFYSKPSLPPPLLACSSWLRACLLGKEQCDLKETWSFQHL